VKIHRGSEYARRALRVLVEMGYVDVDESQKTHMYSVRQTENPSSDLHGLQRTFSGSELQKKVDSFLFSISSQPPVDGVDSGIGWKKGYFDPVNGIWVDLKTTSPLPPEVERRYAPTAIDIKTVAGVHALDPITSGECPLCKRKDQNLVWQVSFFDESRIDACCMDCGGYLKDELQKRDKVAS
jgi:hypothetical protein